MSLDIASDYEVVDGLQTITYSAKADELSPYASSVSVPHVLMRITTKELRDGGLSAARATFHLWETQINFIPKANDKLTDENGDAWIVKEVSIEALNTRYKLQAARTQ